MHEKYFLVDLTEGKKAIRRQRVYDLIARLCLKYGFPGDNFYNFTDKQIYKHWEYGDPYPRRGSLNHCGMRTANIKWYIRNKIEYKDPIWNGDFLRGLMLHGCIRWSQTDFPTFVWSHNKVIDQILKSGPFGGKITLYKTDHGSICQYKWCSAPAIYLSYDEGSISYLAGFFAGGLPYSINGIDYARYNQRFVEYIKSLGIPIEEILETRKWILISPIWPALFTLKMPECVREMWTNLKNPCNTDLYAPILWKTYVNSNFKKGGIPYLSCRRSIYYKFKCEEGAMAILERTRISKNLVALDYRVREMVKYWHKEKNKINEENIR